MNTNVFCTFCGLSRTKHKGGNLACPTGPTLSRPHDYTTHPTKRFTVERTEATDHLDALQALVDNIQELGIGPSDGYNEALEYLEANGRLQAERE